MRRPGGWVVVDRLGEELVVKRRADLASGQRAEAAGPTVLDELPRNRNVLLELYADALGSDPAEAARLPSHQVERAARRTVLRAFARGDYVVAARRGRRLAQSTPVLRIASPAPNTRFAIDATPAMPAIDVSVAIDGLRTDPTAHTTFHWTVQVRFNPHGVCRFGPHRAFSLDMQGTQTGSPIALRFNAMMGGQLTFTVSAVIGGRTITARSSGWRIFGTNPARGDIQAAINDDTLQRIACQESGQTQFDGPPGAVVACPKWSNDRLGGVGVFQITVPRPTDEQVWNWRANLAAARGKLASARAAARAYPGQILHSHTWARMVADFNAARRAAHRREVQIGIAPLAADQIEDDGIRGYNGYGTERDQFGYPLHEFRLRMNGPLLFVSVDETTGRGLTEWERVLPVALRGTAGDADYVNHVKAASPTCGG